MLVKTGEICAVEIFKAGNCSSTTDREIYNKRRHMKNVILQQFPVSQD